MGDIYILDNINNKSAFDEMLNGIIKISTGNLMDSNSMHGSLSVKIKFIVNPLSDKYIGDCIMSLFDDERFSLTLDSDVKLNTVVVVVDY